MKPRMRMVEIPEQVLNDLVALVKQDIERVSDYEARFPNLMEWHLVNVRNQAILAYLTTP